MNIPKMEQQAHESFFRSGHSHAMNTYDINYTRCEWALDPSVRYIKGAVTTYFKPTTGAFNQMQFDLDTIFAIDSITYHNTNIPYTRFAPSILQVNLPGVIAMGTNDSVTIHYQGVPPSTGFGSFAQTTHGASATPIIWTLSEPYGAQDWWPCKQDLNDKIDSLDIIVTTPSGNRVASNGVLVSETTSGTDKIYHWHSRHRIAAYLIGIAVTNYAYYSDFVPVNASDSIEVLNYVYPEDLTTTQTLTPAIINIIHLYDSLTILYPFADEKYGHAQFGWGGGIEHQTMSFVAGFGHELIAHECAHQWFGDHVTCGSWQDIWLNEGFATYFEGLTEERYYPSTWYAWKHDRVMSITSLPGGSVLCDDTTSVGRIFDGRLTYNKGAYLLHMLRWKLGDSLFFAGLKNYLTTPGLARNYARTPDLEAVLESTSGMSLMNFFNQWYYGKGYPSYQVVAGQTGNTLQLTINQSQSDPSVTFFEMPVPIKFIGETRDTTLIFNNTYSGQQFSATVNFPILSAEFDPELWLLSRENRIIGIQDYLSQNFAKLFPNPSSDVVTVMIQLRNRNEVTAEIFDARGRKVYSEKYTADSGRSEKPVDIKSLSHGMYELKITCNEFSASQKLVKK